MRMYYRLVMMQERLKAKAARQADAERLAAAPPGAAAA